MSGGNGLHARHQYQGGGMKDDKDGTQLCGQWHRVCELAALPEQAGRSAWLEGRALTRTATPRRPFSVTPWWRTPGAFAGCCRS